MRVAVRTDAWLLLLAASTALAQPIRKPPEFEDPAAFRSTAPAAADGSSHISARGERISQNLLRFLAAYDTPGTDKAEYALFQQGYKLLRQGLAAAAVASFREAAKRHPQSEPVVAGLSVALYLIGELDESASALVRIAELYPRSGRLVPLLGETADASSRYRPLMEQRLRDFVRADAKSAAARYYLAQLLASEQPQPPAEAATLWTEAAALDPRDVRPCLSMARLEENRDRVEAAIAWLNRALERDPLLPDAHYRLSRLYFRVGKKELGNRHLERFRMLRGSQTAKQ